MSVYKFILLTFACFVYQTSLAQFSNTEIVTGVTFTGLTGANIEHSERQTGFKVGALAHLPITYNHYLKVGIVYHQTKLFIDDKNTTVNSIIIPTYFKLGLSDDFFIYFGPEAHIYIDQLILEYCKAHNCKWYKKPFIGGISNGDVVLSSGLEFSINDHLNLSIGMSFGLVKILTSKYARGYYSSTSVGLGINL